MKNLLQPELFDFALARPISFSPPMVAALFEDRKSQTRRAIHPQPLTWDTVKRQPFLDHTLPRVWSPLSDRSEDRVCPYAEGDRLWVREAWRYNLGAVTYKSHWDEKGPWFSPATMKRFMARLWLEVRAIRTEKLQGISVEDCIAEGLHNNLREQAACDDLREQYQQLWNRINRITGLTWDTNPWVWVISFRRIRA